MNLLAHERVIKTPPARSSVSPSSIAPTQSRTHHQSTVGFPPLAKLFTRTFAGYPCLQPGGAVSMMQRRLECCLCCGCLSSRLLLCYPEHDRSGMLLHPFLCLSPLARQPTSRLATDKNDTTPSRRTNTKSACCVGYVGCQPTTSGRMPFPQANHTASPSVAHMVRGPGRGV